jgi:hypothetical protein
MELVRFRVRYSIDPAKQPYLPKWTFGSTLNIAANVSLPLVRSSRHPFAGYQAASEGRLSLIPMQIIQALSEN